MKPNKAFIPSFSLACVASFLFVVTVSIPLQRKFSQETPKRVVSEESKKDFSWLGKMKLEPTLVVAESDAAKLKAAGIWWMYTRGALPGWSAGIRLNASPELFDEIFPNYGENVRNDATLWNAYFQSPFQTATYLESAGTPYDLMVGMTSLGCLDLVEKHGADVVIFGSSETMHAVVNQELARHLRGKPKVANCSRSAQVPENITASAQYLRRVRRANGMPKIKSVVVGFSQFWGYDRSPALELYRRDQQSEFNEFLQRKQNRFETGILGWKGRTHVKLASWNDIYPMTWEKVHGSDRVIAAGFVPDPLPFPPDAVIPPGKLIPDYSIFALNKEDAPRLSEMEASVTHEYFIYTDIKKHGCAGISALQTKTEEMVKALTSLAENVYVFLTPIMNSHERGAVPCLRPAVKEVLQKAKTDGVHIVTMEAPHYGLTAADFTYVLTKNRLAFDPHHVGRTGALKLSRAIANWLEKE